MITGAGDDHHEYMPSSSDHQDEAPDNSRLEEGGTGLADLPKYYCNIDIVVIGPRDLDGNTQLGNVRTEHRQLSTCTEYSSLDSTSPSLK